jgi:phage portal protein BeeE
MLGLAPLASALREVFTDNEAARYAAVMFKNLGVPGAIISPADGEVPFPATEANRLKAEWEAMTTGDQRGNAIVTIFPTEISMPTTDPTKMNTTENRRISEERIAGLLLLPPAIAGLGAGLAHSSENNRDDDARRAFDDNIIPSQDSMAEELDIQLLPDFSDIDAETIEFDQSRVRVLRGDQERKDTVTVLMWNSGLITRSQGLLRANYKPAADGSDDIYKTDIAGAAGMGGPATGADATGTAADSIASGGKSLRGTAGSRKAKGERPKELDKIIEGLTGNLKKELDGVYDEVVGIIEG